MKNNHTLLLAACLLLVSASSAASPAEAKMEARLAQLEALEAQRGEVAANATAAALAAGPAINAGHTSYLMICMALVQLMTPGLAFFYGGLVKKSSVVTMMMQSYISMGVITVLWFLFGFVRKEREGERGRERERERKGEGEGEWG